MTSSNQIAEITSSMGDPVRVNMLMAMRCDGTLTAGELARVGNVAPSTASEHLARMVVAGLVVQRKQGRRRLYSIADAEVCDVLDAFTAMAGRAQSSRAPLPDGLIHARLCYDHLAGRIGCQITGGLFARGLLAHAPSGIGLTADGHDWLRGFGIDAQAHDGRLRCPLRLCRDWTEDSHHLGGGLASALLDAWRGRDWLRTRRGDAQVHLTPKGVSGFRETLGLDLRQPAI